MSFVSVPFPLFPCVFYTCLGGLSVWIWYIFFFVNSESGKGERREVAVVRLGISFLPCFSFFFVVTRKCFWIENVGVLLSSFDSLLK